MYIRKLNRWIHSEVTQAEVTVNTVLGWVGVALGLELLSPDGHVSVLGLAWLGTALQWCLGDSWHGLVHQHLLVLHFLTCATQKTHHTVYHSVMMTWSYVMRLLFDRSFQKELSVLTHFVTFWYQNSHSLKSEGPAEQICKDRWLRPSLPCFLIRLGWLVKTATRMCSYL